MAQICYHRVLTRFGAYGSTNISEQNTTIGALTSSARCSLTWVEKTRDKHATQIKRGLCVWCIKEPDRERLTHVTAERIRDPHQARLQNSSMNVRYLMRGVSQASRRRHTGATQALRRRHTGVTQAPRRRHAGFTLASHRRGAGVTRAPLGTQTSALPVEDSQSDLPFGALRLPILFSTPRASVPRQDQLLYIYMYIY